MNKSIQISNEVVRAGAGAGKTRKLTEKVLSVVATYREQKKTFPHLIVTTFTRKATQELRTRLIQAAKQNNDPELIAYITSPSQLHISTIHGVLNLYLSRFGHLSKLDPSFSFINENKNQKNAKRILKNLIGKNPTYLELVEIYGFNQLTELTSLYSKIKIEYRNINPFSAEDIELFSEQWKSKIHHKFDETIESIKAETKQSKWLETCELLAKLSEQIRHAKGTDLNQLIDQYLHNFRKPTNRSDKPVVSENTDEGLKKLLVELKETQEPNWECSLWPKYISTNQLFQQLAEEFSTEFQLRKLNSGEIEISDLELLALDFIRNQPQTAKEFAKEWDYWLIDEYQDTSPLQVTLLDSLIDNRNAFIVGDPQQSIYLFRGARSEVFSNCEEKIKSSHGVLSSLLRNYRSAPELLLFFNDFFTLLNPQFNAMEPNSNSTTFLNTDSPVATFLLAESQIECEAILYHITNSLDSGVQPHEIAVLCRTNRQLDVIADLFKKYLLPYQLHSSGSFYNRQEVIDLTFLIKAIINPHDNKALTSTLRSPWLQVDDNTLALALKNREGNLSHYDVFCLQQKNWSNKNQQTFAKFQSYQQLSKRIGVFQTLLHILRETDFITATHALDPSGRREANIWKFVERLRKEINRSGFNYLEFINQILAEQKSGDGDESDAVAAISPKRINLMTIHAAKGLQFSHVFIPFMHERPHLSTSPILSINENSHKWSLSIPTEDGSMTPPPWTQIITSRMRERELEEQDRLLYVAMTRAKNRVFLSWQHDKLSKNSWAGKIKFPLKVGLQRQSHYCYSVETGPWITNFTEKTRQETVPTRPILVPPQHEAGFTRTSVTDILDQASSTQPTAMDKTLESAKIITRGIMLHQLFEKMKFLNQDKLFTLYQNFPKTEAEQASIAIKYVLQLKSPPLLSLIKNGYSEWGFLYEENNRILEGQVDLWGFDPEDKTKVWIIDYKTGSSQYKEKAFKQLNLYAHALHNYLSKKYPTKEFNLQLSVVYPLLELAEHRGASQITLD